MEKGRISTAIQATIELLESTPVRGKDIETTGFGILTAIKNLKLINEAVIKAENAEAYDEPEQKQEEPEIEIEVVPEEEIDAE